MAFLKTIFILFSCIMTVSAQLVIEEIGADSSETKTINLGVKDDKEVKSEWRAAFLSLALPGTGQFYLGQKKKGTTYISADIMMLAGAVFSEATSRRKYKSSIGYARVHAGTNSNRSWKDKYWNEIGLKDSTITNITDWNQQYDKYREFDKLYSDEDAWAWTSMDAKDNYVEQRKKAGDWNSASYFFLGGMILNRVVSFIDARVSAKRINSNVISNLDVYPHYSIFDGSGGFSVVYNF